MFIAIMAEDVYRLLHIARECGKALPERELDQMFEAKIMARTPKEIHDRFDAECKR